MIANNQGQIISPLKLFYSYADKDEELCKGLEKQLSPLQQQGIIAEWHHRKILPGANRNLVNDEHFSSAQIILLLISPDFLSSSTSHAEMQRALQRHETGLARVIPIYLRPVDWEQTPVAHLQSLPHNGKAVTTWRNRELAFVDIVKGVRSVFEEHWNSAKNGQQRLPGQTGISIPPFPFVFLSYTHIDLPLLRRLKDDLQTSNIIGWADHTKFLPGDPQEEEEQRKAIRNASAVVLVASPRTRRSRSVKEELRIAEMYQRPIYLFWMQGNQVVEVIPGTWKGSTILDAREERYTQALQQLLQALSEPIPLSSQNSHPERTVPPLNEPRNPYKGLQAFRVEDARDFFGRDRLINELVDKIKQLLTMNQQGESASRLLGVLGPSGSGKSSVVMAGMIPRLKQGALVSSQHWIYLNPIVPGFHPLEELTKALAQLFPQRALTSIREDLEDDAARGLHMLLTTYVKQPDMRVLLIIDQFEELFTQAVKEEERRQFIELLLVATTEPYGPLITVVTLRADCYDRLLEHSELGRIIEAQRVTVYPMEAQDLRAVIEQPAQLADVQLTFDEDLVGDLLFELQGQAGALPLLQFTLDQLFEHRQGQLITRRAYNELGGVRGALSQRAEATYKALPTEDHRRLARVLFLRLIDPGQTEQDTKRRRTQIDPEQTKQNTTRRRATHEEFNLDDPGATARLQETMNAFITARLLTTNKIAGIPTVEVSHEAVIREWPLLIDWLREARKDLPLQQALSEDAAEWERRDRPTDRLYRGSQLKEARSLAKRATLNRREMMFLRAGVACQTGVTTGFMGIILLLVLAVGIAGRLYFTSSPDPRIVTTISSNVDEPGSLPWAIARANVGSTITFADSLKKRTILLTSDLSFTKNLTIQGPTDHSIAISGGKSGHIVRVPQHIIIAISDLLFINSDTGKTGMGFIKNEGTLTLTRSTVSGNTSVALGGGITNMSQGKLTLINSSVLRNKARYGGGIYDDSSSELILDHSTIAENVAAAKGGGIYVFEDSNHQVKIISCIIRGNAATHDGGGIYVATGSSYPVEMNKSQVIGNHAPTHPDIVGKINVSQ